MPATEAGQRVFAFLRGRLEGQSRAALAELLASGAVRVNGRRASKGDALRAGDEVQVRLPAAGEASASVPALAVLHEDAWLIAVDKPAGLPSHALRDGAQDTAARRLLAQYPELDGVGYSAREPGLLHRLDTDTSGVLLAARTREAFVRLRALHEAGGILKTYVALCAGELGAPRRERAFLDASGGARVRVRSAQPLRGRYLPITTDLVATQAFAAHTLATLQVVLARRHQLRAHLAALGHPIAGDGTYGGSTLVGLTRHFLHAARVVLVHPWTGDELTIASELPADLAGVLARLAPATR